ncbi:phytanoyl-CoA dioxygenase domain-containing protein 1-like [Oppia nitens]|uniref:phytanoyl-CoA dioxygenase domain-containing protein 1-like n=1 Tax=Oppia nitens TaxID=1686743 RepID=UPI0023DA29C4|nr:phytanoyl-CoA dioxygenase domain-containing protein 1-like [Oppia nitens]
MDNLTKVLQDFQINGYAIIEDFLSNKEVETLKSECKTLIDKGLDLREDQTIFTTGDSQQTNDYFMNSGDKIRYFYESHAFNDRGELVVDKYSCLNKIGHALHWMSQPFKEITFSDKVKQLVKQIGFVEPVVVQSMYIFKNPGIGGEVMPHQDATYLHAIPDPKVIGLWFALEDATTENGCLEFIPGSHHEGLHTQWIRTTDQNGSTVMKLTKECNQFKDRQFVSAPVKKGSAVVINGFVIHKSAINRSTNPRPIYTFHIFEQKDRVWDSFNWLQPTHDMPFPSLYKN